MALNLMYITNRPDVALIAEEAGADRIFVDMEYIGKTERQGGMDTVQSRHTLQDVKAIASVLTRAELLVRVNPIHERTEEYESSEEEIDGAIASGAQMLMLPYFKTLEEVKTFLGYVNGRAKTMLLLETPEAVEIIDDILALDGIDCVHIGLNDLRLGYKMKFMFQPLADGTVDKLCEKLKAKGIPYGFGGIASLGRGKLPAEKIIKEHYRLGSTCAILSRSFCNVKDIDDLDVIHSIFIQGVKAIREYESVCRRSQATFEDNRMDVVQIVEQIVRELTGSKN